MLKFNDWLLERTHAEIDKETEEVSKEYDKASAYDEETARLKKDLLKRLFQEIEWPVPVKEISSNGEYIYFETEGARYTQDHIYLSLQGSEIKAELNIGTHVVNFTEADAIDREKVKIAGKLIPFLEKNLDKVKDVHAKAYEFELSRKDGGGSWKHADTLRKLKNEKEKLTEDEILSKVKKKEVHEVEEFTWQVHNGRRGKRSHFYPKDGFYKIEVVGWKPKEDPTTYIVNITRHYYPKGHEYYDTYQDTKRVEVTRKEMIELAKKFLPEFRGARVVNKVI